MKFTDDKMAIWRMIPPNYLHECGYEILLSTIFIHDEAAYLGVDHSGASRLTVSQFMLVAIDKDLKEDNIVVVHDPKQYEVRIDSPYSIPVPSLMLGSMDSTESYYSVDNGTYFTSTKATTINILLYSSEPREVLEEYGILDYLRSRILTCSSEIFDIG